MAEPAAAMGEPPPPGDESDASMSDEEDEEFDEDEDEEFLSDSDLGGESESESERPSEAERPTDDAATFVLAAERVYQERTAVFHQQSADSLCPFTRSVVVLVRESRQLSLLDTQTGSVLDTSARLPFNVYSTAVDEESGWTVAAGNERTEASINVALLRIRRAEDGSLSFDPAMTRTVGVGRMSRGSRHQANCVRFGCSRKPPPADAAAGAGAAEAAPPVRVLLVGSQDRSVYAYPLLEPVAGVPHPVLPPLVRHRFETAINCAAASPDGRWLAASGDTETVYVVGSDGGFLEPAACASLALRLTRRQRHGNEQAGSQYCVWSADGMRLAASSDTLHAVAVWAAPPLGAPAEFVPLARFAEFPRPALALTFLPQTADGSHLLAWSELDSSVYVADVDHAAASDAWARPLFTSCGDREMRARGVQRIRLPPAVVPPPAGLLLQELQALAQGLQLNPGYLNRVTGLCCAGGSLFVAQTMVVTKWPILSEWSKEQHSRFPVAFRRAARVLLLGASQEPTPTDESALAAPLPCLPKEIVVQIIALAAMPRTCWLPARLSQEEEDNRSEQRRYSYPGRFPVLTEDDMRDNDDDVLTLGDVSAGGQDVDDE